MAKGTRTAVAISKDLVIERVFNAPRELVWRAWTDCEHLKKWWGPKDFTSPACEIDLRVGGRYLICMRDSDGKDYWSTGAYKEIVERERLVCTDSFADEKGNVVSATHYGMGDEIPLELLITVTFERQGDKTKMTLRQEGFPPGEHFAGANEGWRQSFDKLEASLAQA